MSEDRLITVAIHTYEKAVMLKSLLESEGVPVVLHNVNLEQPIVSSGIRVRIKEKDLPLALRIIENVDIFSNVNKSPKSPQKIIVPIDFSESSLYATRFAFNYAKSYNNSIVFLHSYLDPFLSGGIQLSNSKDFDLDITDSREKAQAQAEEDMDKFCSEIKHLIKIGDIPPIKFTSEIREGVPEDVINSYAKQIHPTSIIMGTRGYGKKEKELIGSVTAEVLDTCRYPVFSIPEDAPLSPTDVYNATYCMLEVLKAGGFTNGGLNFDSKPRRGSMTHEDIFLSYISGMDSFALGLKIAYKIIEDGRIDAFVKERYASYNTGIGADIVSGKATLESLSEYALKLNVVEEKKSGAQEYLESVINQIMFGGF